MDKKWTKNINIFDKDFIIVPINKNAHWFLAVICYPSLKAPAYGIEKRVDDQSDMLIDENYINSSTKRSKENRVCIRQ